MAGGRHSLQECKYVITVLSPHRLNIPSFCTVRLGRIPELCPKAKIKVLIWLKLVGFGGGR